MHYSIHRGSTPNRSLRQQFIAVVASAAAALATLLAGSPASAQLNLTRTMYTAPFTCGAQRALSVNLPTPVETGPYSTFFSMFNSRPAVSSVISVFAALPGNAPVFVESFSLPGYGHEITDCADILAALRIVPVPDAVVGQVHLLRPVDDLEVYATYTRTASVNGTAQATPVGGASLDVERVVPRQVDTQIGLTPLR